MHPQIRQVGPGTCPICGMALEPEVATADTGPNPELSDMTRRFCLGLALSAPVVVLEMGGHLMGGYRWIDQTLSNWIQFLLATPVVLWAGWPFFVRAWQSAIGRSLNMFTLIAMGVGVAYVYSTCRNSGSGHLPLHFPRPRRRRCRIFRGCGGHHGAGPAGPGARIARTRSDIECDQGVARPWLRKRRAASATTAATKRSQSTCCSRATACACVRTRKCRSTARSSKAAPHSTNRW